MQRVRRSLPYISAAVAVLAFSATVLMIGSGTAGAGSSGRVDASMDLVSCTVGAGTFKFDPAITMSPTGNSLVTIKTSLSGCAAINGPHPRDPVGFNVERATLSGDVETSEPLSCSSPGSGAIGVSGDLSVKWTTKPMLSSGDTVLPVTSMTFGENGSDKLTISFSFGSPSGSFQGTDDGAEDAANFTSKDSVDALISSCESGKGLSKVASDGQSFDAG